MSIALATRTFGSGGAEPYAEALVTSEPVYLVLTENNPQAPVSRSTLDVSRWTAEADDIDRRLLLAVTGPVLDVGCGPGRMVRAAMDLGMDALGIDVSPAAIRIADDAGLRVLETSIFSALPSEGHWQTVLLVDGNVGIGGNIAALLARCVEVLAPMGEIVVEVNPDRNHFRTGNGTLVGSSGSESESFPWSEVGLDHLVRLAAARGLALRQSWQLGGRSFCRLAKIRP
ncbi:bifunctional 2-polyprenyl-6-hydroxyphenol methylase/3-demethylubiquinol 3-O-methyltransferase UbiG [Glaciihabitans sp. dw_435]|uniref:class I SAM-dependent methyltransferase n=1 Tax=Glaciihabitans sp. dw_435 TaxID=2720081 RepID=UPI001BD234CA|nr:class I SAM-dependent methyltransferase [Glaciihabitans sp. dw_435]